jgi:DNA-binding beta-propeller fold protein YncE
VSHIDPDSLEVADGFEVGELPEAITASENEVWVVTEDTVARIDPTELTVTDVIELDTGAYRLATQGGSAWVTAGLHGGPMLRIG